jgi:hypothetical protein
MLLLRHAALLVLLPLQLLVVVVDAIRWHLVPLVPPRADVAIVPVGLLASSIVPTDVIQLVFLFVDDSKVSNALSGSRLCC